MFPFILIIYEYIIIFFNKYDKTLRNCAFTVRVVIFDLTLNLTSITNHVKKQIAPEVTYLDYNRCLLLHLKKTADRIVYF